MTNKSYLQDWKVLVSAKNLWGFQQLLISRTAVDTFKKGGLSVAKINIISH